MFSKARMCGFTLCLLNALSSVCGASVYSLRLRPIDLSLRQIDFSRGLDASTIQPIQSLQGLRSADIQRIIPTDLNPNDQQSVAKKILNNSVNSALKSEAIRNSSIGSTIHSAQESMQTKIALGGTPAGDAVSADRSPTSVRHELKVAADPMQTLARINYSGLANAQLSYRASESKMDFEMRKPVGLIATDLVFNHTDTPTDRRDLMSVRWVW